MINAVGAKKITSRELIDELSRGLRQYDAIIATIVRDMQNFPRELFEDDELLTVRASPFSVTKIFPLGEYRQINLHDLKGCTTLYFGSDGRLYEYGPAVVNYRSQKNPIMGNVIKLRAVDVERLEYVELQICRDLLRQVWIV